MDQRTNLPLAIEIEINSDCNLSCSYCPNSKTSRVEKGFMSHETYKTLMVQLKNYNYSGRISYHFYNEPLLSPDLNLFIQMTSDYLPKAKSVLYSNGTFLTEQRINELYSFGLSKFIITEHHQVKLDELNNYSQSLHPENISKFRLNSFKQIPFTNRGGLVKVGKKINAALTKPCFIPRCVLVISLKGNVIACYEDYNQKHTMGNILETDILEIWNSNKYKNFREELQLGHRSKFEICKDCNNQMLIV